ncbi:MAG: hypothetical protein JRJ84_24885 [Deltaproteobacteria bacterium]|nr:hypothetical protein [Deltaproteobacteria bacterium]
MRLVTPLVCFASLLLILACGGGTDLSGTDFSSPSFVVPSSSLSAPWTDMGIPVEKGNVMWSDDSVVTIMYDSGSAKDHGDRFYKHFADSGWTSTVDTQEGENRAILFEKDGATASIAIGGMVGGVNVSIALDTSGASPEATP